MRSGGLEFHSVTEGANEVAPSCWLSEENIRVWKSHSEQVVVQALGRKSGMSHIRFKLLRLTESTALTHKRRCGLL